MPGPPERGRFPSWSLTEFGECEGTHLPRSARSWLMVDARAALPLRSTGCSTDPASTAPGTLSILSEHDIRLIPTSPDWQSGYRSERARRPGQGKWRPELRPPRRDGARCAAVVPLDGLHYDWPIGFARFEMSAMNPTRAQYELDTVELVRLADPPGHPVAQIPAHD